MRKYALQHEEQFSFTYTFKRDGLTWFSYLMLGYYTYLQATLGSLAPFLREELHLSYTDTGMPTAAFAAGIILVGLLGNRATRLWKRSVAFWLWLGASGMALGALALMCSQQVVLMVGSAFVMGTFGALLQFMLQATLADHHRERRAVALTEANVVASIAAGLAPLLIGALQYEGLGWRSALFVALAVLTLIAIQFCSTGMPHPQVSTPEKGAVNQRFPVAFWLYWLVLVCSVAIEWCMIVWSAIFLKSSGALSSSIAATMVSLFFVAEVGGRLLGSYLLRTVKSATLLPLALGIAAAGFALFWIAPLIALKIVGLFLTGLGVANLFPLVLAVAIGVTPRRTQAASARLSLGAGIAILAAPFVLGRVADALGIQRAYGLVACLLVTAVALTLLAGRASGQMRSSRAG